MRNPRIYTASTLALDEPCTLDENASKHISKVLKMKTSDSLRLFNGDGNDYQSSIIHVDKKTVTVTPESKQSVPNESDLHTHLAIVMSRGDRMDYAIQKSIELGVNEITPLTSVRCEVKLSGERADKRIAHWQQVAISACEQCGRSSIPFIHTIQTLDQFVKTGLKEGEMGLVLHHRDTQNLESIDKPNQVRLLIGPEGGLAQEEIRLAQQNGYKACTLGPRVFRTETAPVASLAVLQWLWGDFC